MIEPRRWREHRISLSQDGTLGKASVLSAGRLGFGLEALPSQRVLLVSPDGSHLAYASAADGSLRVRDTAGRERAIVRVHGRDARFSPDGRYLAAVTTALEGRSYRPAVEVLDLRSGARRTIQAPRPVRWLEWVREGVVALHRAATDDRDVLTLLPLQGHSRRLAAAVHIERFTAAGRGSRVVYFTRDDAYSVSIDPSSNLPRRIGPTGGAVRNAEMSADGERVVFATATDVRLIEGDRTPRVLEERPGVHAIWFSADGKRLAYGARDRAVVHEKGRRYELSTPWGLHTMRFRAGTGDLILVHLDEVLLWRPGGPEPTRLAKTQGSLQLEAADLFGGQVVLWTSQMRWGRPRAALARRMPRS